MEKKSKKVIVNMLFIFLAAAGIFNSCDNFLVSTYDTAATDDDVDTGWTAASHGDSAEPDYDLIFDDSVVHRIDISIGSAYYEEMENDLESMYGDFGSDRPSMFSVVDTPMWVPVTVSFEGKSWNYVGMRYKGNSSLMTAWLSGMHKLPFRLDFDKFEDLYTETEDQKFWGFGKLTFSNGMNDDSFIRDKIASVVFQDGGLPAAEAAFCRVYIDNGEGSVYWGLYTMLEDPSDQMLDIQFEDGTGNLYKPDDEDYSTLAYFDEEYYPKKTNEDEDDWSDIKAFIETLNDTDLDEELWRVSIEEVFNVDGFLDYLVINNTIENWDVYGSKAHNYYLYSDPSNDNIFTWIPWDMNESFTESNLSLSFSMDEVGSSWPLIRNILDHSEYEELYEEKLNNYFKDTASDKYFDVDEIKDQMSEYSALIEDFVIGDNGEIEGYTWLDSDSEFSDGLTDLQEHIDQRFEEVSEYLTGLDY